MASVHIVYGFTEGKWHGKKFRRALKRRGYNMSRSITNADIIIGHSGGCFDVPPLRDEQLLMLINPPYWPERSIVERAKNMGRQIAYSLQPGRHFLFNANKAAHNALYLLRHKRTNQFMAHRAQTFNLEQEIKHYKTILVRNSNDPWLSPDLHHLRELNPHVQINRLEGDHDDCWLHPEPYIDILEKYRS